MSTVGHQAGVLYSCDGKPQIRTFNIPLQYHGQPPQRRDSVYSHASSDLSDRSESSSQGSACTAITEPSRSGSSSPLSAASLSSQQAPRSSSHANDTVKAELHRLEFQFLQSQARSLAQNVGDSTPCVRTQRASHASQSAYLTQSAFKTFPPRAHGGRVGLGLPHNIARPNLPTGQAQMQDASSQSQPEYAPYCPIGNHRTSLSRVDNITQTQGLHFGAPQCPSRGPRSFAFNAAQGAVEALPPKQHAHPRRTVPSSSWSVPPLRREEEKRRVMVEQLVETASQLVATLWPSSEMAGQDNQAANANAVISLRQFVRETLRRSRTSYNSLQLALFYLVKLRAQSKFGCVNKDGSTQKPVMLAMHCGRRMLLTALILAAKYLQDRNFSARAWHKISGLPISEITANEMAVLEALDWKLHVGEHEFNNWSVIVHKSTELVTSNRSSKDLWKQVFRFYYCGKTVEEIAKVLRPAPPQLTIPSCNVAAGSNSMLMSPFTATPSATAATTPLSMESISPIDAKVAPFATPASMASALSTPSSRYSGSFTEATRRTLPPPAPGLGTALTTPNFTPRSSQSNASSPAASAALHATHSASSHHVFQPGSILPGMGWMASPTSMGEVTPTSERHSTDNLSFELPTFDAASLAPQAAGVKRRAPDVSTTDGFCEYGRTNGIKHARTF